MTAEPEGPQGLAWPVLIVGLLALSVGANGYLFYRAGDDPSFAIQENYYRRAVEWDRKLAADAQSDALGWSVVLEIGGEVGRRRELTAALSGDLGEPIEGATISLTAFQVARSNRIASATFSEIAPGRYRAELEMPRAGLWQLDLFAERGSDRFIKSLRKELFAGAPR